MAVIIHSNNDNDNEKKSQEHGNVTYLPFEEIMTDSPTDQPTNLRFIGKLHIHY